MKNKKGFTLVELMIVIGVSAILALITVPSMMNWYAKDKFINQTREIIDTINDARAAALSNKKCSDNSSSTSTGWRFFFINNGKKVQLICKMNGSNNSNTEKTLTLDDNVSIESLEYFKDNTWIQLVLNNNTKAYIDFSAGKAVPQISTTNEENSFNTKKLKMTFQFSDDSETKRTICFDRISGFPTISKTTSCAE